MQLKVSFGTSNAATTISLKFRVFLAMILLCLQCLLCLACLACFACVVCFACMLCLFASLSSRLTRKQECMTFVNDWIHCCCLCAGTLGSEAVLSPMRTPGVVVWTAILELVETCLRLLFPTLQSGVVRIYLKSNSSLPSLPLLLPPGNSR